MLEHFRPRRIRVPDSVQREETPPGTHRYRCQRRKLTLREIDAIRRTNDQTLRELAVDFGVSHETIRAVRRRSTGAS